MIVSGNLIWFLFLLLSSVAEASDLKVLAWKKVKTYPHDPQAFTQGLVYWEPGILAESTGQHGASSIRRVDLATGRVLSEAKLDQKYFGEGLAKVGDVFIQLTWQNGTAFKWKWSKKGGWTSAGEFSYAGEGWGLATGSDGTIYMSNGSAEITSRDKKSFKEQKALQIKAGTIVQDRLNELEVVGPHIFANRWQTTMIVRIKAATGEVDGIMDIHDLVPKDKKALSADAVPNGIAWNPTKKVFYVTGKLWPELYEIKVEGY